MTSTTITLAQLKSKMLRTEVDKNALPPAAPKKPKQNDKKIAREARKKRIAQIKELRKLLHEAYPVVFDYQTPLPLAVGIHKEIALAFPQYSHVLIRNFLTGWVRDTRYLNSILISSDRYNLANEAILKIEQHEKDYSLNLLNLNKKTNKEKSAMTDTQKKVAVEFLIQSK